MHAQNMCAHQHAHVHIHTHMLNTQACIHNTVTVGRVYSVATVCFYESGDEGGSQTLSCKEKGNNLSLTL